MGNWPLEKWGRLIDKMPEVILTRAEIGSGLRELRKKYGCTDREFRDDPSARNRVSDEDEFEWEAFLAHSDALRQYEEELHRRYLSQGVSTSKAVADKDEVAEQLAA